LFAYAGCCGGDRRTLAALHFRVRAWRWKRKRKKTQWAKIDVLSTRASCACGWAVIDILSRALALYLAGISGAAA
jgi:hypothetical protein